MRRRILFLSALDFKEKSIQVIRKTPEAYVRAGWDVRYIVARDTMRRGNYFYEDEINPEGVRIERFPWSLARLRNWAKGRWMLYFWSRLAGLIVIFQLAWRGARALRQEQVDVVYGYEMHGVLALRLLSLFRRTGRAKTITRFQGTWGFHSALERRDWARIVARTDLILALRAPADLVIMTNDGTHGDRVMQKVAAHNLKVMRYWPNGVDIPPAPEKAADPSAATREGGTFRFISVSRLIKGKGLERCLAILAELRKSGVPFSYRMLGDGAQRPELERIVEDSKLGDVVTFTGAVPYHRVFEELHHSDCLLSMYDNSNVGNPLLEAIRSEKLIVTLDNGGTGEWITHEVNGLIYDPTSDLTKIVSRDLARLIADRAWQEKLLEGVRELSRRRLWTWNDRLESEIKDVQRLLKK